MRKLSGLLLIGALLLSGCAASKNREACTEYEAAYNAVADAVDGYQAGTTTSAEVRTEVDARTGRIKAARETATGIVSAEIGNSGDLSQAAESGDNDPSVAFFMQAEDVAKACADDGARIDLH